MRNQILIDDEDNMHDADCSGCANLVELCKGEKHD